MSLKKLVEGKGGFGGCQSSMYHSHESNDFAYLRFSSIVEVTLLKCLIICSNKEQSYMPRWQEVKLERFVHCVTKTG